MNEYNCYILISNNRNRSYIGCTNNIKKRLRQHNGEITGGAKATKTGRPWTLICYISGFDKSHALCCEWRLKRRKANNSNKLVPFYGVTNKIINMYDVLNLERFTKKCNLSNYLSLTIHWNLLEHKQYLLDLPDHVKEDIFEI